MRAALRSAIPYCWGEVQLVAMNVALCTPLKDIGRGWNKYCIYSNRRHSLFSSCPRIDTTLEKWSKIVAAPWINATLITFKSSGAVMTAPSVKIMCKRLEIATVEKRTFNVQYVANYFSIFLHTCTACLSWSFLGSPKNGVHTVL